MTSFSVVEKMFSLVSLLVLVVSHSLWPAIAEADARGDVAWLRNTVIRALGFAVGLSATLAIVLVIFGQDIIQLWIGSSIAPAASLLIAFGCWKVFESVGATNAIYLNARGIIRPQVIMSVCFCIASIAMKFYLVRLIGAAGTVWATSIADLAIVFVPSFRLTARSLKQAQLQASSTRPH